MDLVTAIDYLDADLKRLGKTDSSIQYARHIRNEFNMVVDTINQIKKCVGLELLQKESDWYFE